MRPRGCGMTTTAEAMSPGQARAEFRAGRVTPTAGWAPGLHPDQPDRGTRRLGLRVPAVRPAQPEAVPGARRERGRRVRPRRWPPAPTCAPTCPATGSGGTARWSPSRPRWPSTGGRTWSPSTSAARSPSSRCWPSTGSRCGTSSRVATCRCTRPGGSAGPRAGCTDRWWCRCDRYRPGWWPPRSQLSGRMPAVHGTPVHVGDPGSLLVGDIDAPEFGDPVVSPTATSRSSGPVA